MAPTLATRIGGRVIDEQILVPVGDEQFTDAFHAAVGKPLFQVTSDQVYEFVCVTDEGPEFVVVPPFPIFRISLDRKRLIRLRANEPMATVLESVVFDHDDEIVLRSIVDLTDGRGNWSLLGSTLRVRADGGLVESRPGYEIYVPDVEPAREILEILSVGICAALFGMLYTLDHREVRITDVAAPLNRQQRREAERKGKPTPPTYVVRIPNHITISQVARDLEHGRNRRKVRPHERRAHMRRDRSGNKTIRVRNSRINSEPGAACSFPIYNLAGVQIGGAE